jgi:glycosyltransferase involved in cell wall biosynthesis
MRLAILASHPIQYYAPIFRELAARLDIHVFYAHRATPEQQAGAGFGKAFEWDVDLTSGYANSFLHNVAVRPGIDRFEGCDTPEIGERLDEGRFDALLTLGWRLKSNLQGLWAAKRRRLPVMVRGDSQLATPRTLAKRAVKGLAYPTFLRLFDAALYVGARSRAYFAHYRYPPDRLFFSPHCVDNAWFADHAEPEARRALRSRIGAVEGETIVLFAGKLVAFKRPLDVIEAASRLPRTVRVLVAGAGELAGALDERARALGVRLDQLGFQNQTAMPCAYAAADVLMLPSDGRETWGLVCNEALACGCPILVSEAVGCAPDLAGDGQAGLTYPLADMDAAASALSKLIESPPPPAAIAERSRRYGLAAAADGIVQALERVSR